MEQNTRTHRRPTSTARKSKKKEEYIWPEKPNYEVPIGEHITQSGTTPIFQYYAYATQSSTSPTAPSSTLEEKTLAGAEKTEGLTKPEAETVASVLVTFKTAPRDGKIELGRDPVMSTQSTFAFEAPNSETPISAAPCE